ncbi:hypothetical protein PWY87_33210 [Kribbella solani]|uniref:hypothetical protein n=1 Tax=Kribbella solani TaxID=236067 RepID=UPI0029B68D58|nr:hypothetical protein [Kribbella solani]MDX3006581.1 hypothetical protein [Kribbella solani]
MVRWSLAEVLQPTLKTEIHQDQNTWPDETTCRREVFRWHVRYDTLRELPA